jgi:hypothetical protein
METREERLTRWFYYGWNLEEKKTYMDELMDRILELKAELREWESAEDFFDGDGNYQHKLERLSRMEEQYAEMYAEWEKNFYAR